MKRIINLLLLAMVLSGCGAKKEAQQDESDLPYPPDIDMQYYQAQSDSGYQKFWTDIRAVSSAFLNNSKYADIPVKSDQYGIISEEASKGRVEIKFEDMILQLTLVRKFRSLGTKSVWQVIAANEKPWPKHDSR